MDGPVHADEGVGNALPLQPSAQGPEGIQHAGPPSMSAKEDEAAALLVRHLFVVNQDTAQFHQAARHGHIVRLALDDVGEEDVGLARQELSRWNLLDAEDDVATGEVFADRDPGGLILLVGEDPNL